MHRNDPELELMTVAEAEASESTATKTPGRLEMGIELFALFATPPAQISGRYDRDVADALDAAAAASVFLDGADGN